MSDDVGVQLPPPSSFWRETTPLLYTSNPWSLLDSDLVLFLKEAWSLPNIVWPFTPFGSGPLDELYPSRQNIFAIVVHLILSIAQLAFLVSIPLALVLPIPFGVAVLYIVGFLVVNYILCLFLLNGHQAELESSVDLSQFPSHDDEKWIFLNGVAVGNHWLQGNIDRIAYSFRRPVLGVHNPTSGIVFDVLQCLIQRDFTYVTQDIRNAYAAVKKAVADPRYKTVVFIIHSQGGIEGGLILDWLLADMPADLLGKLEIYTFGNAANHFNNPQRPLTDAERSAGLDHDDVANHERGVFRHIEHYANTLEFVSRWGVLHFDSWDTVAGVNNRYRGRVFERYGGKGHQLNQHYLDNMFPLVDAKRPDRGLREKNDFMDSIAGVYRAGPRATIKSSTSNTPIKAGVDASLTNGYHAEEGSMPEKERVVIRNITAPPFGIYPEPVKNLSRLWQYRNGRTPKT